jgi:hypothetical protein
MYPVVCLPRRRKTATLAVYEARVFKASPINYGDGSGTTPVKSERSIDTQGQSPQMKEREFAPEEEGIVFSLAAY